MSTKRRAYLYARVSALPQIQDLLIEMQLSQQQEYAQKNNIEVVDTIIDHEGLSRDFGPKFREMMEAVPKQNVDLIIVFSIHRITRNLARIQELVEMLKHTGIALEAVDDRDEWAENFYLNGLFAYWSNRERSRNMKKVRQNLKAKLPTPPNDEA
jgi:DNA invertase Pin-like site-specific DNA recombinase